MTEKHDPAPQAAGPAKGVRDTSDQRIQWIRNYRAQTGCNLAEALKAHSVFLQPDRDATTAQAGPELPPLPRPLVCYADHSYPAFSTKQMQEYARSALRDRDAPAARAEPELRATGCAACRQVKLTPLRVDAMGGYVCLTCIDARLTEALSALRERDAGVVVTDALRACVDELHVIHSQFGDQENARAHCASIRLGEAALSAAERNLNAEIDHRTLVESTLETTEQALAAALTDMLAGWRYIRANHGDLYGVGWDRAQNAAEAALASTSLNKPPADAAPSASSKVEVTEEQVKVAVAASRVVWDHYGSMERGDLRRINTYDIRKEAMRAGLEAALSPRATPDREGARYSRPGTPEHGWLVSEWDALHPKPDRDAAEREG